MYVLGGTAVEKLHAINTTNGKIRWVYTVSSAPYVNFLVFPVVSPYGETVYVGYNNKITALNTVHGSKIWEFTIDGSGRTKFS